MILSLRERCVLGKTASISDITMGGMVANSLTKRKESAQLTKLRSESVLVVCNTVQHRPGNSKTLAGFRASGYDETNLLTLRF